ncbi:MAG: AsmA-like C-terminal domain-containing protein [Pirellulales bacterium]|nr:AsmA-like C-terminal domain-containing protein [Pirellulales bacterium]
MLGIIGGVAAVPYFYRRVDEEIGRRLEECFAQHYPGLKVTIGSAELVEHEGIKVRDLAITEPGAEGPRAELLHVEELFLRCHTTVQELLYQEPTVTHVTVRRPVLRITRRRDGVWSVSRLFPPPQLSDHPPEVTVEDGTIEIFDPLRIPCSTLTLRDFCMTLGRPVGAPDAGGAVRETRSVQGSLTGDHFRRVEFRGAVDARGPSFSLSCDVEGLEISPELRRALPSPICGNLPPCGELRGESNLSFRVVHDPGRKPAYWFQVAGQFRRGRLDDPRLPHPLTEICTKFRADNGGVALEELTARMNQARLQIAHLRTGFEVDSPLSLQAEIQKLELDRQLLGALPDALQAAWYKFLPDGQVDADVRLEYDGRTWRPELSMRCQDLSFTYYKFPYRFNRGNGRLDLKDDRLTLSMTARGGGQPISMQAEILQPLGDATGTFEAWGKEIPLDEAMIHALPEKSRKVVQSLDPHGAVDFYYHSRRRIAGEPPQKHLNLKMNGCSIHFNKFPYLINNVRGNLVMTNHQWTFSDLEGYNGAARITGSGSLAPTLDGNQLVLKLEGKDVPLGPELHRALPPNIQVVWDGLQPSGVVDLGANISYLSEQKRLSLEVSVRPQSDTASITPVRFPYRLEKLQGTLLYRDGQFTLRGVTAEHGPVKIAAEGEGDFQPDGQWTLRLAGLTVRGLPFDRDLIQALPERMKKTVLTLDPRGPINLSGSLDFFHRGPSNEPLQSAWNVRIDLLQESLRAGVLLENVSGAVFLRGGFDGRHASGRGELALDSLHYKNYQFTQIRGPLWIDDDRVLLGRPVDDPRQSNPPPPANPPQTPRSLSAQLFGGTLLADGRVTLGSQPRYAFGASLSHASLGRCALEVMDGRQKLRGDIMATLSLQGAGATRNALSGGGKIHLSDADVYELPVMISLLKILNFSPPDRNAFSTASIDYRIEGEHIYFDAIDFNGDAISLEGKGDMDWQSNIRLNFHTMVGRGDVKIPFINEVREVLTGAGRGIMQIQVDGTLQNPQTRQVALPAVNQALQQLQSRREERKNQ